MRIPVRYPVVELAGCLLWASAVLTLGVSPILPAFLWFASVTLALIATDLEHHRLPNRIVFTGLGVGVLLLTGGSLLDGGTMSRLMWAVVGGVAWFSLLLVVALLVRGGFGFGDVKMAALLGLFVAYQPTLEVVTGFDALGATAVSVFLSFFIGGVAAMTLLVLRRAGRRQEIAFGPAMILASWIGVVRGPDLLQAWLG